MKTLKKALAGIVAVLVLATGISIQTKIVTSAAAITDANNGDWTSKSLTKYNTSEAEVMVRVGDIDNFSYNWNGLDPFTGKETSTHGYPFKPGSGDPDGTDRIMVVSGYHGSALADGYTGAVYNKSGYDDTVRPVTLTYDLKGKTVNNAYIQMFVDDIQPSKWVRIDGKWVNRGRGGYSNDSYTQYEVTFIVGTQSVRVPEFETIINNLDQHGPIGKMITFKVPDQYLSMIQNGGSGFKIKIDDPRRTVTDINGRSINNTGDGYAIDFVKLLVNKNDGFTQYDGTVQGKVYEAKYENNELVLDKTKPLSGVNITISGVKDPLVSNATGAYSSSKVPAGQVIVQAEKNGYAKGVFNIATLKAGEIYPLDIGLVNTMPPDMPRITQNPTELTNGDVVVTITYPGTLRDKVYRINGGSWMDYTSPITVDENCEIEAQSQENVQISKTEKQLVESSRANHKVTNIDKTPPTGRVIATREGEEVYLTLEVDELDVTVLPAPDSFEYEGKTYTVTRAADGDEIFLGGNRIGKFSIDKKKITCIEELGFTFRFKDLAGNVGTAFGKELPMKER